MKTTKKQIACRRCGKLHMLYPFLLERWFCAECYQAHLTLCLLEKQEFKRCQR